MKYCNTCGLENEDNARFCVYCGKEILNNSNANSNRVTMHNPHNIKERNIGLAIIFSILTCGIYLIYWMVKINDETLELSNKTGPSGVQVVLLTILTCGIYGYFWAYNMGRFTDSMRKVDNGSMGIVYIIFAFLGLNIVNFAITQDAINNAVNWNER